MNAGLILGAVALAGLAMAAMQGARAEADETGFIASPFTPPHRQILQVMNL